MKSNSSNRAELVGDDSCSALGITVRSSSPVLALCRKLVDAGHDPATPLEGLSRRYVSPPSQIDWPGRAVKDGCFSYRLSDF